MVIFQSIVQFIYLLPLTSLPTIHLVQGCYSTPILSSVLQLASECLADPEHAQRFGQ